MKFIFPHSPWNGCRINAVPQVSHVNYQEECVPCRPISAYECSCGIFQSHADSVLPTATAAAITMVSELAQSTVAKNKKPAIRGGLVKAVSVEWSKSPISVRLLLPESWPIGIETVFPINAGSPVAEAIVIFDCVHFVGYVVRDHGLQLTRKTLEHTHLGNRHESSLLQFPDVARDCREVLIDAGKTVVRPAFSSKMRDSQFAPPCADSVRVRSVLKPPDAPVFFIGEDQAKVQEKKLREAA